MGSSPVVVTWGFFPVLADETDCCTACVILYITSPSNNSEKIVNKDCP